MRREAHVFLGWESRSRVACTGFAMQWRMAGPAPLEIEERSHSDLANAYVAGAANLPFAVLRGYTGSDFPRVNERYAA